MNLFVNALVPPGLFLAFLILVRCLVFRFVPLLWRPFTDDLIGFAIFAIILITVLCVLPIVVVSTYDMIAAQWPSYRSSRVSDAKNEADDYHEKVECLVRDNLAPAPPGPNQPAEVTAQAESGNGDAPEATPYSIEGGPE